MGAYLLWLHGLVTVHGRHLAVHWRLCLTVCSLGVGGDLARVHVGRLAVVGLRAEGVAGHAVVRGPHWVLCVVCLDVLSGEGLSCLRHTLAALLLSGLPFGVRGRLFARNNVNQEVEHVGLGECRSDVGPLQGSSLVLLGVDPCAHSKLRNEDITALGEQYRRLGANHLDLRVRLHDLLYTGEGQLVELVVVGVALEVVDCLLPVCREDVLVLAIEALVNICPRARVELCRRIPLG